MGSWTQRRIALEVIRQHSPARIVTLGECSVSVAPFSILADRNGDDLAISAIRAGLVGQRSREVETAPSSTQIDQVARAASQTGQPRLGSKHRF